MSTNGDMPMNPDAMPTEEVDMAAQETAPMTEVPATPGGEPAPTMAEDNPAMAEQIKDRAYAASRYGEMPEEDSITGDIGAQSAAAARQERARLMPEYLQHYFVEDLPPINPDDPWNQGIYMRYRINQWRYVNGMDPVE